jgi:hypothetical protein
MADEMKTLASVGPVETAHHETVMIAGKFTCFGGHVEPTTDGKRINDHLQPPTSYSSLVLGNFAI